LLREVSQLRDGGPPAAAALATQALLDAALKPQPVQSPGSETAAGEPKKGPRPWAALCRAVVGANQPTSVQSLSQAGCAGKRAETVLSASLLMSAVLAGRAVIKAALQGQQPWLQPVSNTLVQLVLALATTASARPCCSSLAWPYTAPPPLSRPP